MRQTLRTLFSVVHAPWKSALPAMRLRQTVKIAALALLVIGSAATANTLRYRYDKSHYMPALSAQSRALVAQSRELAAQGNELEKTKLLLQQTNQLLASAQDKLGYLNRHKTAVQVTAFTGQGRFASGRKAAQSYAVPCHTLPEDKVLNVALSPAAQRNLHARMNDYIVLLDKNRQIARLAHFVDTTAASELRPVVDVFFAREADARTFGRQTYLAVNISAQDSPFRED